MPVTRTSLWSPLLLAAALAPSILQAAPCNAPPTGDASLTSLTVKAGGIDRVVGFNAGILSYDIWLDGATIVDLSAVAVEPGTVLRYWIDGASGFLGTGSGQTTLDVTGAQLLYVTAWTSGRATKTYVLNLNPACADDECDDNNPCTMDTCTAGACEFAVQPDGAVCEDGFCDAGICQPYTLDITRVMFTSDGLGGNGRAWSTAFSLDGSRLYFASSVDNLVPGDDDGQEDLFVFNRDTGTLESIDVDLGLEPSPFWIVDYESASADLVTLLYHVGNGALPDPSVGYAHDLKTGVTERVTFLGPILRGSQRIDGLVTSDDARRVVYRARNPEVANTPVGIFLYDRDTEETRWVSEPVAGMSPSSQFGRISGDGRFVVFANIGGAVYVHEISTGETTPVSLTHDGQVVDSYIGSISRDGRFVAFLAEADGVVPEDDNGVDDIFLRDRELGTTRLVSKTVSGELSQTEARSSQISRDGRFVGFIRALEPGGHTQVYVWDAWTDSVILLSVSASGEPGNSQSFGPQFSEDGSEATFSSWASNLVPNDDNGQPDTFLVTLP